MRKIAKYLDAFAYSWKACAPSAIFKSSLIGNRCPFFFVGASCGRLAWDSKSGWDLCRLRNGISFQPRRG